VFDNGVEVISIPDEEVLLIEIEHFIDCINNHSTPITDGNAGIEVLETLEIINKRLKKTTKLNYK
jgi:predicted dehydrogenase